MPVILSGTNLTKSITDATAIPADVSEGKIFYNNEGRQVGTYVNELPYRLIYPTGFSNDGSPVLSGTYNYHTFDLINGTVKTQTLTYSSDTFVTGYRIQGFAKPYDIFVGFYYNGTIVEKILKLTNKSIPMGLVGLYSINSTAGCILYYNSTTNLFDLSVVNVFIEKGVGMIFR